MKKRNLVAMISGVVLLGLVMAGISTTILFKLNAAHASSGFQSARRDNRAAATINNLNRISVVGSTAFIVDGHGRTISVDANPYGVAVAPNGMTAGALKPGDVVVTDFGANSTGITLVRFPAGKGPGLLFNNAANPGTKGPALEAFNIQTESDWVANFTANNVQVFRTDGTVKATITNPLFNMPWAMTSNRGLRNAMDGSITSFFTTNAGNATIDRIDVIPAGKGTTFRVFQIGQLTQVKGGTKSGLAWVPSLQLGGKHFSDVLLALDLANNRIAAYPNSTTMNTTATRSTNKGITAFQGKPLNTPASLGVNPLNGDILAVNANDNNLVELNLAQGKAVGIRLLDNVPVDAQSGNGSALVGLAAATDAKGNLEVFYTDDNLNTLNVLSV
jgi:hypothetical protein